MFEYVSFDTFAEEMASKSRLTETELAVIYHKLKLPKRSTKGSAGYDFFSPITVTVPPGGRIIIPTGIKVNFGDIPNDDQNMGFFLGIYPRSSYGFKYGMRLMNTVGIIDQDYYDNPANEGHIILAIETVAELRLVEGEAFCQGIIQPYYKTIEIEEPTNERIGGLGSTTNTSDENIESDDNEEDNEKITSDSEQQNDNTDTNEPASVLLNPTRTRYAEGSLTAANTPNIDLSKSSMDNTTEESFETRDQIVEKPKETDDTDISNQE